MEAADARLRAGDVEGAIALYLKSLSSIEEDASSVPPALRRCGILRHVLELAPMRLDLRAKLAEELLSVGLRDDARRELARVVDDAVAAGEQTMERDARARLRSEFE